MKQAQRLVLIGVLYSLLFGLAACSLVKEQITDLGPTLGDLRPVDLPTEADPVPVTTLNEIEASYRAALEVANSPDIRHRILVRLADIEMARSENRQLTQLETQEHFSEAINMYDELLALSETQADNTTNERILYRLSKAYALDGRVDESDAALAKLVQLHPGSVYALEADFRRAEQAFSLGRYREAELLYAKVAAVGDDTPFYLNSIYMQGWSQFKANKFEDSIASFTTVLDRMLLEEGKLEDLSSAQQSLASDTLRVIAINFSYLDGAKSIDETYDQLGERHYAHLLYAGLGDLYLDKKRYKDAADSFQHFIIRYPKSDHGPLFAVRMMEVYKQGGFPDQILPAKEAFVQNYGIGSPYWVERTPELRVSVLAHLGTFIDELSSFYHSEAQKLKQAGGVYQSAVTKGKRPKIKPEPAEPQYQKAAFYYKNFLQTFPESERKGEMTYLMAEARYESGDALSAVDAYEQVAFDFLDPEFGAKAGYASIVVLQQLMDARQVAEQKTILHDRKIADSISFADYYPGDPRAIAVLTKAAEDIFSKGDHAKAVPIAIRITQWQPAPDMKLQKTAWLIVAHSQFDAKEYDLAEASYREVLARSEANDPDKAQVVDRMAASIYQSAEAMAEAGETDLAINRFLQVPAAAPGSEIAITAQYDAGNYLLELKQWQRAEQLFKGFERSYAQHPLAATLAPKFVLIYQEMKLWDRAADYLGIMANNESDPAARQQALYLSAELYQKSGRLKLSAEKYAKYIKRYPEDFALATEARYQSLQIAKERGDTGAQNYWLKALISAHKKAKSNRTDRSKYLAAFASNKFANDEFENFERIKLTLPIKKSLKAKKSALDRTLSAYKTVLNYSVAEFTTEANYRIGNVYSQLSRDLLNSERPKGLDALSMEQYEILLEEQAFPFEEKSVDLLAANAERAWEGFYDDWVKQSIKELSKLLPARYGKKEKVTEVSRGLL